METAEQDHKSAPRSDEILDAVREKLAAAKIVDVNEETIQLVFFTLAGAYYAIRGEDIREILYPGKITPVPGTPPYLLGLINVRGDVESVIDFNLFLSLSKELDATNKRILIAEKNGMKTGIMVGSVADVVELPKSGIGPSIGTIDSSRRDYISGMAAYRDTSVPVLDLAAVFKKMEKL